MVFKKRQELGFSGCGTPIVPTARRSVRKRKKSGEEEKVCAFELLATVAGKLLEESEGSASSNATEMKFNLHEGDEEMGKDNKGVVKSESFDRGSCEESVFAPESFIQEQSIMANIKGGQESDIDLSYSHGVSYASDKLDSDMKLGVIEEKVSKEGNISGGMGRLSVNESLHFNVVNGSEVELHSKDEKSQIGDLSVANIVKDPVDVNTNSQVKSESSVKLPLYREPFPCDVLQKHINSVKLGIRDDDEKFSGCNKYSIRKTYRTHMRIGNRRLRKTMASRHWKTVPKLKNYEVYTTCEAMNAFYRCRKGMYPRERFQQAPIKKRKLFDQRLAVAYDGQENNTSISNIHEKAADGVSTCMKVHSKSKDHVTVSIKSFKVPELYVEVPENDTVGSLKRTVMEAVTSILGRGIRIGIVFQGKNVRDDNQTLQQAGISQCTNLENLGFTLEPSNPKPHPVPLSCPDTQMYVQPSVTGDSDSIKPDNDTKELISSFPSKTAADDEILVDGASPQNLALVPISPINAEALAAVPLNQKPKRSEVVQRRTRRPFSVAEVEALVEAVEKLGTGRWRDVKMRAFADANHRTYVDLKDKWKTLVHTASISPQQRRGEPVPHELLDRVLSAHSYWSHHQSKPGKLQSVEPPMIMDSQEAAVGAAC